MYQSSGPGFPPATPISECEVLRGWGTSNRSTQSGSTSFWLADHHITMTSKQNQSVTTAAFYHFLPESAQVETVLNVLRFSQLLIRPIPNPGHRSHYVRKRYLKSVPTFGQCCTSRSWVSSGTCQSCAMLRTSGNGKVATPIQLTKQFHKTNEFQCVWLSDSGRLAVALLVHSHQSLVSDVFRFTGFPILHRFRVTV